MKEYQMTIEQVLTRYGTERQGLSHKLVQERLSIYGNNLLPQIPPPSLAFLFIRQFKSPLMYLLGIAALLILFLGNINDALVTIIVLIGNAAIGTFHESRAQRTLQQLQKLLSATCIVVREGKHHIIDVKELVPGDIVLLQEGDQIPADARVMETRGLHVNESLLTGESTSIEKIIDPVPGIQPPFDQRNIVFKGSTITSGSGEAIVIATGKDTYIGKLQEATIDYATETPLQHDINHLAHSIVIVSLILCGLLFALGYMRGQSLANLFSLLTALFICILPEGLPVVFTIALAASARRLAKLKVLVKRLQGTEGLGRIDVIMFDKTGTLTQNEMVVRRVAIKNTIYEVTGDGYQTTGTITLNNIPVHLTPDLEVLRDAAALLDTSEKKIEPNLTIKKIKGEPTEAALGIFSQKLGFAQDGYTITESIPFDFATRLHYVTAERKGISYTFISGAPEAVFARCDYVSPEEQQALTTFLEQGLRTVALAQKVGESFNLIGILALEDTIRPEALHAVQTARKAGIIAVMLTGDHKETAEHIAEKTGILLPGEKIIQGNEIADHTPHELSCLDLSTIRVFSRVTPQDKLTILHLYRQRGHRIAMVGDGINDVPSLVAADVGIAMGSGTDVAREAADLILMDDSFQNIVNAIAEGRHVVSILRRVIWYFFSTNLSELLVIIYAFCSTLPLPLSATQILWLNVITDGFLDAALAMEPHEKNLMNTTNRFKGLLSWSLAGKIIIDALVMTVGSLIIFYQWHHINLEQARTMTLMCLVMFQWFNAFNCRTERASLFSHGFFSNRWLIGATILVFFLQIAVVYVPFMQVLFHTTSLHFIQWVTIIGIASSIVVVEEVRKFLTRKFMR